MKTPLFSSLRRALALARETRLHPQLSPDDILAEWQARQISRRQFLHTSGRAGLVLGLGALAGQDVLMPLLGGPAKPNIAIVGAGLGGLSAGYHLRRRGVQATLFEADKRVGGRMKSARVFANGQLNTEIGAEFIDTVHEDMFYLARLLGLDQSIMDVEQDIFGIRDAIFIEGKHYGIPDVIAEFAAAYPKILADRKRLNGRHYSDYDRMSMAEYIDGLPLSNWVKKMLDAAFIGENGLETAEQSAVILVELLEIRDNKEFLVFGESDERFKIIGGNEQIPQGLAKILREQIRLEHRLLKIRENANRSITLFFSEGGNTKEFTCDAVILALPFTILREVEIEMELPEIKKRAIKELGYGTNTKFILETRDRPWRTNGYRGFLFNEKVSNGWDSAQMQLDNKGMGTFTVYYGGKRGLEAVRGTENAQLGYALPQLEAAFPGTRASLTGKHELAPWPSNPFVKASYSCYKPGQLTAFDGVPFSPVRNLFFAGEHTSADFWGFMNGAAETGRKAAQKVLKKMKVK
ncbi:MAG: NAD(P)/FAD-dependent oxidoreductase [Saprospiraceae bacterium]